jgi:peptidoglycan/xylan/chitin deacetylase (PgdA/CDA1 family)
MFLKKDIKIITKKILYHSRLADFLLGCNRHKLLILCHHRIAPGDKFTYLGISQDIFEEQIVFLKKYFKIVSFDEGVKSLKANSIKESLVVLNFDDGYRDNYTYAFPVLKKYNITATIFVTVDYIGTKKQFWWDSVADTILGSPLVSGEAIEKVGMIDNINYSLQRMNLKDRKEEIERINKKFGFMGNNGKEREMLDWEEIKEMERYGIDFGSHTLTHPNLTLLGQNGLVAEVLESKENLEYALKKKICSFAYPYGLYNKNVKRTIKKSNYLYARSMLNGFNDACEDMFALKCISGFSYTLNDLAARLSYRGLIKYGNSKKDFFS